jgi:Ca-activated chloride channel homolog
MLGLFGRMMGNIPRMKGAKILATMLAALSLFAAVCSAAIAAANGPASLVIIFEGSRTMWGKLYGDRQSKLVHARDALRHSLASLRPETRVGLASFGHRRVSDCSDVQLLQPPDRLDANRILTPLEKLNPKGKGSLTLALREAARALSDAAGARSIVLIHDDLDRCQLDSCAALPDIQKMAPGIVIHVIGLGLKKDEIGRMSCLSGPTGGRLFDAQSASQISLAVDEALRLADAEGVTDNGAADTARPSTAIKDESITEDAQSGLRLRALLAIGGAPVARNLYWKVTRESDATGGLEDRSSDSLVFEGKAQNPLIPAAAGRYLVEVRDGLAVARQTVVATGEGATRADIVLQAGTLRVKVLAQRGGPPLGDAIVTISEPLPATSPVAASVAASGQRVSILNGVEPQITLPAGSYRVRVEYGLASAERSVVVPVGTEGELELILASGRLQLMAAVQEGGPVVDNAVFSILEDDPDAPRGRREIARFAGRMADFVLPTGTYYVLARQGSAETRERIAIAPGEVVRRTLITGAVRLALASRLFGGSSHPADPVSYRIERLDTVPPQTIDVDASFGAVDLASGRYRIESRYGLTNVRAVREVELKAGQNQLITFEHRAGVLRLKFAAAAGPFGALPGPFWEITDETGHSIWSSVRPDPELTLQAGRYVVRGELRDKSAQQAVELKAGETREVELMLE